MAEKFMLKKTIVIPLVTLVLLLSNVAAAPMVSSEEMAEMLHENATISIEMPYYKDENTNNQMEYIAQKANEQVTMFNLSEQEMKVGNISNDEVLTLIEDNEYKLLMQKDITDEKLISRGFEIDEKTDKATLEKYVNDLIKAEV